MAQLSGHKQIFHSTTPIIDTSLKTNLGTRALDVDGNEYVYLQGIASTVAGDWVVYDEDYLTTRLVSGEVGPIAIAMAAITASSYGWYQIYGVNTIARTDTIAADSALYANGTAGRVDDLGVVGDLVIGAYSMTADTSNVATVFINYSSVSNEVGGEGTEVVGEVPTGAGTTWTLANTPLASTLALYRNGTRLQEGAGNDYTLSTATITLALTLRTGHVILADYRY